MARGMVAAGSKASDAALLGMDAGVDSVDAALSLVLDPRPNPLQVRERGGEGGKKGGKKEERV
jgi:hypothetical protein